MSGSEMRLKKLPSAVNMSVLVKEVPRPHAAKSAKSRGESASCCTPAGKRSTCRQDACSSSTPPEGEKAYRVAQVLGRLARPHCCGVR